MELFIASLLQSLKNFWTTTSSPVSETKKSTTNLAYTDQQVLAMTAYGENRGGGKEGMQSVLNVIMNRAAKPGWCGTTPREVCLKPYQFSCWLPSDPNFTIITNKLYNPDAAFNEAMAMAAQALSGNLLDLTHGSCYYYAESMTNPPSWAVGKTPVTTIAGQYFFNNVA